MDNYLDDVFTSTANILDISNELDNLSYCLSTIGNDTLAKKLHLYSADLRQDAKFIRDAVSADISKQVKKSQEFSHTLLAATLAGAIGKK